MFDTVNLRISRADISEGNTFGILPYLSDVTPPHLNKHGVEVANGKMLDYTAYINEWEIFLTGSLCKSFLGDNIQTLKRRAVKQAIEQLSDNLHIDLSTAKVTRLDVSTIIPTKRPPADYYPYLGQKPYFERLQSTPETLYYNNHQRQIVFYDKGKEARAKNMAIHAAFENDNLFRYELRYTNRLNKQLKADVTASTLYDEAFYRGVIQNWYNEFKTIQKLKNGNFMIEDITTLKGAKDALFASLLQEKGQGFIDEILNDLRAANKFNSRSDYTKLRADLNKMLVSKNGNKADLMQELETAFFNIAQYAR